MNKKELDVLKKGDYVYHKYYGKSFLVEKKTTLPNEIFGVIIQPATLLGMQMLFCDSNSTICHFMEDSIKNIKITNDEKSKYNKVIKENKAIKHLSEVFLTMIEPQGVKDG